MKMVPTMSQPVAMKPRLNLLFAGITGGHDEKTKGAMQWTKTEIETIPFM